MTWRYYAELYGASCTALGVYRPPLGFYTALLNITCAPDLWSFETLRDVKKLGVTYWSAVYSDKMGYNSPLVINLKKPWWQFFKWIPVGCNRKSRQIPVWPEGRVALWISGSLSAWLSGSTGVWHYSSWTLWYKLRSRLTTVVIREKPQGGGVFIYLFHLSLSQIKTPPPGAFREFIVLVGLNARCYLSFFVRRYQKQDRPWAKFSNAVLILVGRGTKVLSSTM